ncbi:hypothetical protein HP550_07600 [Cellulomonas humilata]|uniref:Polysaccharide biosynthesis protein n=1 Tax=Cellulomonas humilata TaxID=144055 RepID=A0A7Y5ZZP2_9CELL|nr:hypothetical protein [Cellulomonas humilata]NUU17113.1 hypothetical protein [Cellulomonas humilata]
MTTTQAPPTADRGAVLLSATSLVVAGANYAFALVLVHVLSAGDYVAYASVQSLLLVLGSGAMAAIPWAVARHVATGRDPGQGAGFGLVASAVQGAVFAALTFAIVVATSGAALAAASAVAAFTLSVVVAPLGVLQGRGRLGTIAGLRLLETAVRIGLSAWLLLAVAADPLAPVTGFAVGSAALFVAGCVLCRGVRPLRLGGLGDLTRLALLLGSVQVALAALGSVDTVLAASAGFAVDDAAAYQVAALLGRVPLFVAASVALAFYPQIAAAAPDEVAGLVRRSVRLLLVLAVPVAVVMCVAPTALLTLAAGSHVDQVRVLLPATAAAGLCVALTTVLVSAVQARDQHRRALRLVVPAAVLQPVALGLVGQLGGVGAYAVTNVTVLATLLVVCLVATRRPPVAVA